MTYPPGESFGYRTVRAWVVDSYKSPALVLLVFLLAFLLVFFATFFFFPILNASLIAFDMGWKQLPAVNVDTRARDQWPEHPFIRAQDKFANKFGGSASVAIAVVVEEGTIFTPEVLGKIETLWGSNGGRKIREELEALIRND